MFKEIVNELIVFSVKCFRKGMLAISLVPLLLSRSECFGASVKPFSSGLDYAFVKQVGGLTVGQLRRLGDGSSELPVTFDISGLKEISVKPTSLNSMMVVKKIWFKRKGYEIHISLVSTYPHGSFSSSTPGAINLGKLPIGDYRVIYDSPKGYSELGTVTLK